MKWSASLTLLFLLYLRASANIAPRDAGASLPQCAVACAISIPGATNMTSVCANATLQMAVGNCVKRTCTVKEGLTSQNSTATACEWPHRDRSSLCRNIAVSLLVPATLAVAARIISRLPQYNGPLGLDDYVILLVWSLLIGFTVLICVICNVGLGRDIWTLPFNNITLTLEHFNILTYIYICLTWLTKISILLLYLRLFPDLTFRNIVKVVIVFCCAAWISFLVACILRCQPVSYAWTFWDAEHKGKCPNILISAQGWPHVAVNISTDLVVLLLPLPTILKLNLALEKKLSVVFMFSTGIFVTAVSVFRATTFPRLVASNNFTWDWTEAGLWSAIEVYVGVICACMPGMRAFTRQVFPGKLWRQQNSRTRTKSSQNKSTSSGPSTLGTIGSRLSAAKGPRGDDQFELISIDGDDTQVEAEHGVSRRDDT